MNALFLLAQAVPAEPSPSVNPLYVYVIGGIALAFIAFEKTLSLMERYGFIQRKVEPRQERASEVLKRFGDLTVESAEAKIRHAVRGELQPIVTAMNELKESNTQQLSKVNENLVRMITILQERGH